MEAIAIWSSSSFGRCRDLSSCWILVKLVMVGLSTYYSKIFDAVEDGGFDGGRAGHVGSEIAAISKDDSCVIDLLNNPQRQ